MQTLSYREYQATRRRVHLQLFGTDGQSPATTETGGQPQISLAGAAAVNTTNTLVAVAASKGLYYVELTADELATLGLSRVIYSSATALAADALIDVEPGPWLHDGVAQSGGASAIVLAVGASGVDQAYKDAYVRLIGGTGAGQIRQITDYNGTSQTATVDRDWTTIPDSTTEYVVEVGAQVAALGEVWDAVAANHVEPGSFGEAFNPIRRGTSQGGTASTITLDSQASAVDDFYAKQIIRIVDGLGAGQSNIIASYVGATKVATVAGTWATVPDNSSVFVILPLGPIPGAVAPTASEVAGAVWDEALANHVLAGSFGAGVRLETNTLALIADALLKRSIGGGEDFADGAGPTVKFALCFLAGKWTDNGDGTITVLDVDDTTPLGTISYSTRQRDAIGGIDSTFA